MLHAEVLSDQLTRWCCIDRLSWHDLSGLDGLLGRIRYDTRPYASRLSNSIFVYSSARVLLDTSNMRPSFYALYFLHAVVFSAVISQTGFLPTLIAAVVTVLGLVVWRINRPQDFVVRGSLPPVLVALTYGLVFFAGFRLMRKIQPMNYRANDLAGLSVVCLLLAIYSATIRRRNPA
jgi:hypothetical protein